jgi:hypothetical protein
MSRCPRKRRPTTKARSNSRRVHPALTLYSSLAIYCSGDSARLIRHLYYSIVRYIVL